MNRTPVADWQKLSALYELADTLDPDSLADWLAQLRQQANPLLPQLEHMLAARSQIEHNGFLGALPRLPNVHKPCPVEWQGGARIGPYRLLRKIGSGGMAEVWLAQRDDGAFQRQVAIKLLFRHQGSDALDSFAQRFDRERDILASLDHPHIAGLHDAGVTPFGQPWLALEYVEGQTLTAWCDARCLATEARVRLFRQVLLAVQHAHANLVIHRDLKPGNILVTTQGEVRLLDFGIAKLMETEGGALIETELTRMAGRPMTPQYAAPEQLMGQPLTTACDVYALGVVLYELLCGERPYELKVESTAQLEQAILDTEPRAPSRRTLAESTATARGTTSPLLRKLLANDLDVIVLRALAKQPAQRYGSVEALRADLDRWLGGEPVEARAPSTVYRIGKFVRRHALSVSLSAAAVASLIAVTLVAVVMGLQAREDSARAVAARDFMLNIFQRANQEKSRGADITARDLLDTGRKDVLTRLIGQPKLQAELLRGIAKIQSEMGEYVTADATLAELVRIQTSLHQQRDEVLARADHAYNALQMNNVALASRRMSEALSVRGRTDSDAELNAFLAEVSGWIELDGGDAHKAAEILIPAREAALRELGPEHLRSFRLGQALVRAERNKGDMETAVALQAELRGVVGRVREIDSAASAVMDLEQVNLLISAGRFAGALALIEVVLPRCALTLGPQEQSCRFLSLKKGQVLLRLGRVDEALQDVATLQSMQADSKLPFLKVESLILELRLRANKPHEAGLESLFERVRAFGESGAEVGMRPAFKATALLALSETRLRASNPDQAERWAQNALKTLGEQRRQGADLQIEAMSRMLIGIAQLQRRQSEAALDSLRRAQIDFARALGAEHPAAQLYGLNVALALVQLDRSPEAAALMNHAEPILRESLGASSPAYQDVRRLASSLTTVPQATKDSNSLGHRVESISETADPVFFR